jgi:hypothetical protein
LNRLKSVAEGATWSQTYSYDRYGNRAVTGGLIPNPVLIPQSLSAFNTSTNRINSSTYDSAGNQTQDGRGGLVYRTKQSDKIMTERRWKLMPCTGARTRATGSRELRPFNAVVEAEYTTLMEGWAAVKMSAKKYEYGFNGNLTSETCYDWFDPSGVARDAKRVPIDVPAGAAILKTTSSSY